MAALDQDSSEARTIPAISRERLPGSRHSLRWVHGMGSGFWTEVLGPLMGYWSSHQHGQAGGRAGRNR